MNETVRNPEPAGCVLSIGNFDGVHLGHRAVLQDLVRRAKSMGLPATVVLFEPQPQEYFAGPKAPARLTRFMEKWPELKATGVDRVLCLKFDRSLAAMPAEDFIARLLAQGLGVRHLTVGDDFRFGHDRRGDFGMLKAAGGNLGFEVADTTSVMVAAERVSSTRIRALLAAGDMEGAQALLGRPYSLTGRVMHGERLGRRLGFPTVNLALKRETPPVSGIFAARVTGLAGGSRDAAAYIGRRPAAGGTELVVEAHLLDYDGDLYGRRLEVQLLQRLRDDRHFDSLDGLAAQVRLDLIATRAWLDENVDRKTD